MLLLLLIAYVLGSIPCSLVMTKLCCNMDIRRVGSGNPGATNVYRVNKKLALLVLILDIAKSSALLIWCSRYGMEQSTLCMIGLFSVIGHVFPIWLRFKGGKGVATALGVVMVLNHTILVMFIIIWAAAFFAFRYPSISSIGATIASSIVFWFLEVVETAAIFLGIASIVIAKHKTNVIRLLKKEETRL